MFKSKTKLEFPELPAAPTWEMMEDDLKVAPKTDILFTLRTQHEKIDQDVALEAYGNEKESGSTQASDEAIFDLAMKLVQHHDKLDEDLSILKTKKEKLKCIHNELQETVENVKKQAMTAMTNP